MPRHRRRRSLSDLELEQELVAALVAWLTSPGVTYPDRRLERLYEAYRGRFGAHTARCVCETCCEAFPEHWPDTIPHDVSEPF